MVKQKNPIIAVLLGFIPGAGLMYLGNGFIGLMVLLATFGSLPFGILVAEMTYSDAFAYLFIFAGFLLYVISIIYTAIKASKMLKRPNIEGKETTELSSERFYTIVLSLIPGLGHFQLGLMNRGMTFLASFLGVAAMILFVTAITGRGEFIVFLIILPVLWVYNFFDTMQLLNKKEAGKELTDHSILEDFESRHAEGRKSRTLATLLSMFPGAGHLYLGYQKRGIQLMAAFLFSIYILDVLRLGIFLFFVPIIWFYSFFDGLQRASRHDQEPLEDEPIVSYFLNHQKWIGIGLILLGVYYLATNLFFPIVSPIVYEYWNIHLYTWVNTYLQTGVICLLLIGGGIKLMSGNKKTTKNEEIEE
ncbi:hypothetical protein WAK64_11225 [Bacillus spongiae]|uniref:Multi-TM2 domain-containing protein n=1 Tax=Bacillus spongiae TaxID=2683610 RepID=A0ABU8HED0_9BACI